MSSSWNSLIVSLWSVLIISSDSLWAFSVLPPVPVVCNLSETPVVYHLNSSVDCESLLGRRSAARPAPRNATIFKLNLSKYTSRIWSCQKIRRTDVVYKGFGPTYKVDQKSENLATTVDECRQMIETKVCRDASQSNTLQQQTNDIWATNLSSVIYPTLFQVKSYNITNCILTSGTVWLNRFTNSMESSLTGTGHCDYSTGSCMAHDNVVLIWEPNPEAKCSYLPWKTVVGYLENNVWFSIEGEPIVLTLGENMTFVNDDCGHKFLRTDQGVGISIEKIKQRRKRRNANGDGYNPVTQAELNMKLQGIVSQLLASPEVNGLAVSCALAQETAYGFHDELYKSPTTVMRRLLRNPYVKASVRGRAVLLWHCYPVDVYSILPMEDNSCTMYVPILFNITSTDSVDKQYLGYLDPSINEIVSSSPETDCDKLDPILLELNETLYWYHYKNGLKSADDSVATMSTYYFPSVTGAKNKTDSKLSKIVYKTHSMYNRSDYMHYVDANELHKFSVNEKVKTKMGTPIMKQSEFGASLSDLSRNVGDILNNFSSWWSYLYWFAVAAGAIIILFLFIKLMLFCNSVTDLCKTEKKKKQQQCHLISIQPTERRREEFV